MTAAESDTFLRGLLPEMDIAAHAAAPHVRGGFHVRVLEIPLIVDRKIFERRHDRLVGIHGMAGQNDPLDLAGTLVDTEKTG